MGRLHRVFGSQVPIEAQLVRAALEAAGIPVHVQGADLIPGAFGMEAHAEVWVLEEHVGVAHEIMGTSLRRDAAGALSLVEEGPEAGRVSLTTAGGEVALAECPRCQEPWEPGFEVCWACGFELTGSASG